MTTPNSSPPTPWFRERWPWLLASGPLLVVVASVISAWIAIKSDDGLVSADYYRQGLAAQETLSRSDEAQRLGIVARIRLTSNSLRVVLGSKTAEAVLPAALRVTISHPTRAGLDQALMLARNGDGYEANFRLPAAGHWLLLIEDDAKTWRIMGSVVLPSNDEIVMGE